MRYFLLLTVGAFLFLGGVLAWRYLAPPPETPGPATEEATSVQPEPAKPEKSAKRAPSKGPQESGGAEQAAATEPVEKAKNMPVQPAPQAGAPLATRQAASAAAIPIGTERSKVVAMFGQPSMRTTASQRGQRLETFVYLQKESEAVTFVLFSDGRVVSASTSVY